MENLNDIFDIYSLSLEGMHWRTGYYKCPPIESTNCEDNLVIEIDDFANLENRLCIFHNKYRVFDSGVLTEEDFN